jgi:hypothetical protein
MAIRGNKAGSGQRGAPASRAWSCALAGVSRCLPLIVSRLSPRRWRVRGVAGVWVVGALVVLIGVGALVIDVGRLVVVAQRVQNVVDTAALAGAAQLPDTAEARESLQRLVAANNEDAAWPVTITPAQDLDYFGPGDEIERYGTLEDEAYAIQVVGHAEVRYALARVFGIERSDVKRSAVAKAIRDRGAGEGVFFAYETSQWQTGVTMNGSDQYVEGTVHSNTKVVINGSNQTITGDLEYLHACTLNGSNIVIEGETVESSVMPYPVDYTWEQYDLGPWDHVASSLSINSSGATVAPGRWKIEGNMVVNGSNFSAADCLFVVGGNIIFNGSAVALDRVTLVAGGKITFNGTTERFSCLQDNLFAFSTKSSSGTVITVNGSGSDTWGIIYAPNGNMTYNGADQEIHHGALIGKQLTVNGSNSAFRGMGEGGEEAPPRVELII